ncbi:ABC transporter permease [Salinispora vitiensis]|uniref:ABC transporter permease n=1 Tax=Salinispora vitiensis TaxID=999544 RepID=UPI00036162B2|nr:ABC transporter permease [Salinispora vitiensis]
MGAATVLALGAGAIGAIALLGEYTTGMIRTTFTAVPARRAVLAAKAVVIAGSTAAFGAVVAVASFGLTQGILSGRDSAVGFGDPAALRLLAATALLAPLSALVGMGMAAVFRNSALTIVATITLLFMLPSLLSGRQHLGATILHMMVLPAWQRLTFVDTEGTPWPWTTTGAWSVLATWAAVATGLVVLPWNRRDL